MGDVASRGQRYEEGDTVRGQHPLAKKSSPLKDHVPEPTTRILAETMFSRPLYTLLTFMSKQGRALMQKDYYQPRLKVVPFRSVTRLHDCSS
jgi:hypothetical protein